MSIIDEEEETNVLDKYLSASDEVISKEVLQEKQDEIEMLTDQLETE